MNHQFSHRSSLICVGLLLPLAACGFTGCNWSATTLALENSSSMKSEASLTSANGGSAETEAEVAESDATEPPALPESDKTAFPSTEPKRKEVEPSQLVGSWRDSFFGTRTLTLNEDGTAKMRLDLDFAGSLLFGNRLDFDMKWSLEEGAVTFDVVDGQPAKAAKSAMDTWGRRYVYLVDRVEEHRVEMRGGDGSASYTLQRLPEDSLKRE